MPSTVPEGTAFTGKAYPKFFKQLNISREEGDVRGAHLECGFRESGIGRASETPNNETIPIKGEFIEKKEWKERVYLSEIESDEVKAQPCLQKEGMPTCRREILGESPLRSHYLSSSRVPAMYIIITYRQGPEMPEALLRKSESSSKPG